MSEIDEKSNARTAVASPEKERPFEIKVQVAESLQVFEYLHYPKSPGLIGAAIQQHLCFDFREYSHGTFTGIDRLTRSIIEVDDQNYLTRWRITLGRTTLESGSTKITSSVLLVLTVSVYNGIATYPDFKIGLSELFEDLRDISKAYSTAISIPVRDGEQKYQPDVELFYRDEKDIIEDTKTKIRAAVDTPNNDVDK